MSTTPPEKPQLHMVWPISRLSQCPSVTTAPGYSIRTFQPGDEPSFLHLMSLMDFDPWDGAKLAYNMNKVIPGGWFFAIDSKEQIVATALCLHNYTGRSPFTGDVGWVACHPDHRGKSLALSLTARVTQRFLYAGYAAIQLHIEYYRLPAIKTYLKLGYVPMIDTSEAATHWGEVCAQLNWPINLELWKG